MAPPLQSLLAQAVVDVALLRGRDHALPDDVQALVDWALPIQERHFQAVLDGCAVPDAVTGEWVGNLRDRLLFALLALFAARFLTGTRPEPREE